MILYLRLRLIGLLEQLRFRNALAHAWSGAIWPRWEVGVSRAGNSRGSRFTERLASTSPALRFARPKLALHPIDFVRSGLPLLRLARSGMIGLFAIVSAGIVLSGVGLWVAYESPKSFEAKHLRNARPAITDRDGDLVGAAPGFRPVSATIAGEVTDDEVRMAALMVRDVPPVWWDVAVALEDRRFGQFGWVYGIDLFAFPQILFGRRGGSTLPMQVIGNLSGDKARENDQRNANRPTRIFNKLKRKFRELSSAPSLVAATSDNDYLWFKRLAATHLPIIHGEIGGSTVGIASGAWVMYGKTPMELSPGEAAIFAAALKRNITIRKQPDEKVMRDWAYVKDRARRGLTLAYADGDARRIQGLAEINAMPDTPPLFFNGSLPLTARAHVVYRRAFLARTVTSEAQAELADQYGLAALREMPLRGYSLTVKSMDNHRFKQRMDAISAKITEKLGRDCRLFLPLARDGFTEATYRYVTGHPNCAPADLPTSDRAQVLAVLANERGEIVRFYQSGSFEPIYAGVIGRTSNDGRYKPESEIRDIGSVAKILAALLLAHEGDTPDQRYCRQYFSGRLDSDGTTGFENCDSPGAMINAAEAIARSSNLAILWRLRQIPRDKLSQLAGDFKFKLPTDIDPAYAIAFGLVQASPQQVHNLMHSVGRVVLDRGAAGPRIHVVHRLDLSDDFAAPSVAASSLMTALPNYLASESSRVYVREVLSAVLLHARGTMHFLRAYTPPGSEGEFSAHIGKTGTPVGEGNKVSDKLVTGSLVKDGKYYSYLFMVRAANPGRIPLGRHLRADDFAPLLTSLLDEVNSAETVKESDQKVTKVSM